MKLILKNLNKSERLARFIISLFLLPTPFIYDFHIFSLIQAGVGGVLLFNAVSSTCVIYRIFGVNTCEI